MNPIRLLLCKTLVLLSLLSGCNKSDFKEPLEYNGPISEGEDIEMYHSEKGVIKLKIIAKRVFEFKNGNREFPDGVYLEFYNEFGKLESTLRANHAYFFQEENKWRARGAVEVKNLQKDEQLNTEELFWTPGNKKIFTDKFVTIRQRADVIYGDGLDAVEDLSDYTIQNMRGTLQVEE